MASPVNATLRLAWIFHEVKARIGSVVPVAIGEPIAFEALSAIGDRQALADELFRRTDELEATDRGVAATALRGGRKPRFRPLRARRESVAE